MPRGDWISISIRKELYEKLIGLARQHNLSINDFIEKLLHSPVNEYNVFKCRGKRVEKLIVMRCVDESGREKEAIVPEKALEKVLEKLGEALIIE